MDLRSALVSALTRRRETFLPVSCHTICYVDIHFHVAVAVEIITLTALHIHLHFVANHF